MHGICSTRLWSEVTWLLYSPLTSQLRPRCGLVAAGLGRTGCTRGLTGVSECWLVLSGPPCYRGCPRDLAGPQPEKYQLRSVWRQTDRQHRLALVTTYWSLSTRHGVVSQRKNTYQPYTHSVSWYLITTEYWHSFFLLNLVLNRKGIFWRRVLALPVS